jgi:hypothetical protein
MEHAKRETVGIRWDRWHRRVVMQSLRMMVMSGVVRHAEVDPPQHCDDHEDIETEPESAFSISLRPVSIDEQGWFTRLLCRRVGSPFTHARHTT